MLFLQENKLCLKSTTGEYIVLLKGKGLEEGKPVSHISSRWRIQGFYKDYESAIHEIAMVATNHFTPYHVILRDTDMTSITNSIEYFYVMRKALENAVPIAMSILADSPDRVPFKEREEMMVIGKEGIMQIAEAIGSASKGMIDPLGSDMEMFGVIDEQWNLVSELFSCYKDVRNAYLVHGYALSDFFIELTSANSTERDHYYFSKSFAQSLHDSLASHGITQDLDASIATATRLLETLFAYDIHVAHDVVKRDPITILRGLNIVERSVLSPMMLYAFIQTDVFKRVSEGAKNGLLGDYAAMFSEFSSFSPKFEPYIRSCFTALDRQGLSLVEYAEGLTTDLSESGLQELTHSLTDDLKTLSLIAARSSVTYKEFDALPRLFFAEIGISFSYLLARPLDEKFVLDVKTRIKAIRFALEQNKTIYAQTKKAINKKNVIAIASILDGLSQELTGREETAVFDSILRPGLDLSIAELFLKLVHEAKPMYDYYFLSSAFENDLAIATMMGGTRLEDPLANTLRVHWLDALRFRSDHIKDLVVLDSIRRGVLSEKMLYAFTMTEAFAKASEEKRSMFFDVFANSLQAYCVGNDEREAHLRKTFVALRKPDVDIHDYAMRRTATIGKGEEERVRTLNSAVTKMTTQLAKSCTKLGETRTNLTALPRLFYHELGLALHQLGESGLTEKSVKHVAARITEIREAYAMNNILFASTKVSSHKRNMAAITTVLNRLEKEVIASKIEALAVLFIVKDAKEANHSGFGDESLKMEKAT